MKRRNVMLTGIASAALIAGWSGAVQADISDELKQLGATLEAVESGPEHRIAFLGWQSNPFFFPVRDGALAVKDYLADYNTTVDYIVMGEALSTEAVVRSIEAAISQGYDGIIVCPVFDGTAGIIDDAVDAGIPVITMIAEGQAPSKRMTYVGQNNYAAGGELGKLVAAKLGGEGKFGVITGYFGAGQHEERMGGTVDYLKENHPDIEIIGPFENKDTGELAFSLTQDMLTRHPDLGAVYVVAGGPFGAAQAIQDQGLTGEVGVVAFDHTPENAAYLPSGEVWGLMDQEPFRQSWDATVIMHNYLVTGENPHGEWYQIPGRLATPENYIELIGEIE